MQSTQTVHTKIWQELPAESPEQALVARCHGYDVYGQLLGRSTPSQMLFLMLTGEAPTPTQLAVLDTLSVALSNPGPRDASVHAAMSAGAAGSTVAASLIAALAVASGRHGGAADVRECMERWAAAGTNINAWRESLGPRPAHNIWPACDYAAGFSEAGPHNGPLVAQTLNRLIEMAQGDGLLAWLRQHQAVLEGLAEGQVGFSLVAAAAFSELGLTPPQGELLYLLLRLPGAGVHALEQSGLGHRAFPFPPAEKLPVPPLQGVRS